MSTVLSHYLLVMIFIKYHSSSDSAQNLGLIGEMEPISSSQVSPSLSLGGSKFRPEGPMPVLLPPPAMIYS